MYFTDLPNRAQVAPVNVVGMKRKHILYPRDSSHGMLVWLSGGAIAEHVQGPGFNPQDQKGRRKEGGVEGPQP